MDNTNNCRAAAIVVLQNHRGEVLLLRRKSGDVFPGWGFPGGKSEACDQNSSYATAKRELLEEADISLQNAKPFPQRFLLISRGRSHDITVWHATIPPGNRAPEVKLSCEHDAAEWFNPAEILQSPERYTLAGNMTRSILSALNALREDRRPCWPLLDTTTHIPVGDDHPGSFGAVRKFDRHTGADLYAPEGSTVVAMDRGRVIAIDECFTGGPDTPVGADGSPIWLRTSAVFVESAYDVMAYGEVNAASHLRVGSAVSRGETIGWVQRVLTPKADGRPYRNPANSPTMLHIERYPCGITGAGSWELSQPQPPNLLDPTPLLLVAR